jgi:hypothetical protein
MQPLRQAHRDLDTGVLVGTGIAFLLKWRYAHKGYAPLAAILDFKLPISPFTQGVV